MFVLRYIMLLFNLQLYCNSFLGELNVVLLLCYISEILLKKIYDMENEIPDE